MYALLDWRHNTNDLWVRDAGVGGAIAPHPQFLADQLTLFGPGGGRFCPPYYYCPLPRFLDNATSLWVYSVILLEILDRHKSVNPISTRGMADYTPIFLLAPLPQIFRPSAIPLLLITRVSAINIELFMWCSRNGTHLFNLLLYRLISTRYKTAAYFFRKLDMWLFFDFCVFDWICLIWT